MKPRLFIGSSAENLDVAYAVQANLEDDAEVTVWDQSVFEPSKYNLESLEKALFATDFGVFVFAPNDVTSMRGKERETVRDNVIFELGMFVGRLGREKSFIVVPQGEHNLHLPSDLLGWSPAVYDANRSDRNFRAALGPACQAISRAMKSPQASVLEGEAPQRVRRFCARVAGPWWERIAGDGIGFFQIQMDEVHNSVRLVDGRFYNEEGSLLAYWSSAAVRIDEENSKMGLVYLRECRGPAGDAKNWFHGYGDMWFRGVTETFSRGEGMFYDVHRDDPQKTLAKAVELRRAHDMNEATTMQEGTATACKPLVLKMIGEW